jgi:hypothetical protein
LKSARFNAAKRYELKHEASTLALAIAGIVGIAAPVYPLVFTDLAVHTNQVINFTSFMIGALSTMLGLFDLSKNYPEKARQFHECGKGINRAVRRLAISNGSTILSLIEDYERAIDGCSENHDEIDYEIGRAQWDIRGLKGVERKKREWALFRLKCRACAGACWLYAVAWIGPLLLAAWL